MASTVLLPQDTHSASLPTPPAPGRSNTLLGRDTYLDLAYIFSAVPAPTSRQPQYAPFLQGEPTDTSETSPQQPSSPTTPTKATSNGAASLQADPFAAGFLRDQLGPKKWETFSSRLFERRLGGPRGKGGTAPKQRPRRDGTVEENDGRPSGATAIDFLVKVEVVKEILRTYVPHPYNPLKSLTHPYPPAPNGVVTLTRSTVLALSGWSNTQFSYWARRSEAVSVLAPHDSRLRAVGYALQSRIRDEPPPPDGEEEHVTGKGLDAIIDEVKKRTGASQFLRGKHSSLDPFTVNETVVESSLDVSADPSANPGNARSAPLLPAAPTHFMATFQATAPEYFDPTDPVEIKEEDPHPYVPMKLSELIAASKSSVHNKWVRSIKDQPLVESPGEDEEERREYFPVSDSRTGGEEMSKKRKWEQPTSENEAPGKASATEAEEQVYYQKGPRKGRSFTDSPAKKRRTRKMTA